MALQQRDELLEQVKGLAGAQKERAERERAARVEMQLALETWLGWAKRTRRQAEEALEKQRESDSIMECDDELEKLIESFNWIDKETKEMIQLNEGLAAMRL